MVDTSFVEVAGKRIKLMPDPTRRNARWRGGGTLALWGTAAIVVGSCKVLGINSMVDLRRVMGETLTPLGSAIKSSVMPIKSFFNPDATSECSGLSTADSSFSKGIKKIFA